MAFDREVRVLRTGKLGGQSALMLGALVLVALLLFMSLKYVPAGHVGVLVFFGRVTDTTLPAGTHLANPLARNITLSVRTQELAERAQVLSNKADFGTTRRESGEDLEVFFTHIQPTLKMFGREMLSEVWPLMGKIASLTDSDLRCCVDAIPDRNECGDSAWDQVEARGRLRQDVAKLH